MRKAKATAELLKVGEFKLTLHYFSRSLLSLATILPAALQMSFTTTDPSPAAMTEHEALNPIHPSVLSSLDPTFVELYNKHVAPIPNAPIDLQFLRSKYSVLYSYGTAPAPEAPRTCDSTVLGHKGVEIAVRMYEPTSSGPWPVHIDYHGGGPSPLFESPLRLFSELKRK